MSRSNTPYQRCDSFVLLNVCPHLKANIETLNKRKAALKAAVEEVKYSGPGEGHRRKVDVVIELSRPPGPRHALKYGPSCVHRGCITSHVPALLLFFY